jgi:hypothetical protein
MIAITTSNSTSVKARRVPRAVFVDMGILTSVTVARRWNLLTLQT